MIGGGAAGFFGAIACAEAGLRDVLILEKGAEVLGKVKISGGGRCNVTHACFDARRLSEGYPRGAKSLLGPFHRWQAQETVDWFAAHGVPLKTEPDGRMFPETDDSQTVIDCLTGAARAAGVAWRIRCAVTGVRKADDEFVVETSKGDPLRARTLLVATGGIRSGGARKPVADLGHEMNAPVPSLFTFQIEDPLLAGLQGVAISNAVVQAGKLAAEGPVLITHWGLSGPAILRLSALGARAFAECDYRFELSVDWTAGATEEEVHEIVESLRTQHGARKVVTRSPFSNIPRRLWHRLALAAGVGPETTWSKLTRAQSRSLSEKLRQGGFAVQGKSLNNDEFVTCGGVRLKDVNLKTMESKLVPGLYFAGEVLDIDGITGGFNFQSAWTTGRLAGEAIAAAVGAPR